jgi:IclR family acetate operon transcriptional repressor
MNVSTIYRLVRTLEGHKFVHQNPSTAKYRLGIRLIELADAFLETTELRTIARPVMTRLMELSGETAHLMVPDGDTGVYVDRVEGPHRVRVASSVGRREHLHSSAVGKALLAHLPEPVVAAIIRDRGLPRWTKHTITDPAALTRHLEEIRRRGSAIDDEEGEEGVRCIGAPIFGRPGDVIAAISIAGPAYRLTLQKLKRLSRIVRAAGLEISTALGYTPAASASGGRSRAS